VILAEQQQSFSKKPDGVPLTG